MVQDLPKIVPAAAEDSTHGISAEPLEGASGEASVCFHVSELGLDGTAPSQRLSQGGCEAAFGPCDQNLSGLHTVATITAVDNSQFRPLVGQDFYLRQRFGQSVAIIGV